jgi:anti-sigma regulatory factor (Ser/Thr protein kinase)
MSAGDPVHQAVFYESRRQLMMTVVPLITTALGRRAAVLAVTTTDNINTLESGLGREAGAVDFVESATWYETPGHTLAAYHRYVQDRQDKHDRVWMIGEPLWQDRDAVEIDEWTRYDSAYNLTFAGLPVSMVCLYDQTRLPAAILTDAQRTHPVVTIPSGTARTAEYADPLRFWNERSPALVPPPRDAFTFSFGNDLRSVRAIVAEYGARAGLSPRRVDDLVIAVNEVTTNAVRHGAGHGMVSIWCDGPRLVCEVSDSGQLVNQLVGFVPAGPQAEHGHGLWLTRQLTDLMEIRNSGRGTAVRLHMRLD